MDRQIEIITKLRIARDKLFAVLERRLARIAATIETKTIIGDNSAASDGSDNGGLAILGTEEPNCAARKLADLAVPRRTRSRKNSCSGTMGV